MFAFAVAAVVFLVTWLVVAVGGPDVMPIHYGPGGADEWGSRGSFLVMSLIGVVIAFALLAMGLNAKRIPQRVINTPHRDYWLGNEHRKQFDELMASMLAGIGALILLLSAMINIAGMWVRDQSWYFPTVLVVFVIGMIAVVGRPIATLYRAPRI
ncbi:hypothetical protein GOEFS_114_00090 [Gordonia effusa NBRC 100432]|uniref:DUF1648 domain-containing protein n=1 Tax=Gordonia effusa NBRC 100432 TaxID=1077974 RepID=H0R5K6_9ACTN|nr:hypothetical protein GOEFS_114_00090 [Gordonia effusa NBRC 100432]